MRRLDASDPGFAAEFDALVNDRRESASDVSADVAAIVARLMRWVRSGPALDPASVPRTL